MIGEPGIFRQDWAVEIARVDLTIARSLAAIFAVVSRSRQHMTQRLRFGSQIGAPAVIFKADQGLLSPLREVAGDGDVIYETHLLALCAHVDGSDAIQARSL